MISVVAGPEHQLAISRSRTPGPKDIAADANRRIRDFVHLRANQRLRPGTGAYSTPFRGSLFGEVEAEAVARLLPAQGVDVLWLGTNPCVRRSLQNILRPPADLGDFPDFEKQVASGFFGSLRWGPTGKPQRDFNPIERPTGNWGVYRELLDRIGRLSCVAMANFIPWGSQSMADLTKHLGEANRPLLQRMLEFVDDLNAEIIAALTPRLVLVPFSLARHPQLADAGIGLSLKRAQDARRHVVSLPEGRFRFFTATCQRRNLLVRTVFVRHPSSLRLSVDSRKRLVDEVACVLGDLRRPVG